MVARYEIPGDWKFELRSVAATLYFLENSIKTFESLEKNRVARETGNPYIIGLTSCLNAIKYMSYDAMRRCKNSAEALSKLKCRGFRATNLSTYDFSFLYHCHIT